MKIWKLNNVSIHTLVILGKRVVTRNSLKSEAKSSTITTIS